MNAPYALFFVPACALLLTLIWREARRRGFAPDAVAAAMAACAVGAVVGSRLLMFDFHNPAYGEKTFLGAMIGGMLTLAIVARGLRFDASAFDVPMIPVLWAAAVGRLGCVVSGCCHGVATSLPWGIRYSETHASQGVLVHPTQLYEAAGDLVLAMLLTRFRDRFRHPGSLALGGAAGLALIRFTVEPLRASAVSAGPLTRIQWTVGVIGVVALGLLWLSARGARPSAPRPSALGSRPLAPSVVVSGAFVAVVLAGEWFTPMEQMVLVGTTISAAFIVFAVRAAGGPLGLRVVPLLGLVAAAPLQVPDRPDSTRRYWAIGGGGMAGGYEVRTEDCEGNTVSRTQHSYRVASGTVEYRQERSDGGGVGVRLAGFSGTDNSAGERLSPPGAPPVQQPYRHDAIRGGSALISLDEPVIGFRMGLAVGNWRTRGDYPAYDTASGGQIMPIGGVRLGRAYRRHGEILVGTGISPAPAAMFRAGLAFPDSTGRSVLRMGLSDGGGYLGGQLLTRGNFELEPYVVVGSNTLWQTGMSVRRRFYMK